MHLGFLDALNYECKGENNRRKKSWGAFLNSQHFKGRRACQSSKVGTSKIDKQVNYLHEPAKTKQQVGQCVIGTFFIHERTISKHRLTRFTTAQTWGKPSLSPLIVFSMFGHGANMQMSFCLEIPKWESRNSQNCVSCNFGGP